MKKIIIAALIISLAGFFQEIAVAGADYMQIISDPEIQFSVRNPNGLVAGYDPVSGSIIEQFGFTYGYSSISNSETGDVALEANEFVGASKYLPSGIYTIIVYGKNTAIYGNSLYISWEKVGHIDIMIQGITDVGKTDTYEFTLSTPMTRPAIIRVASANSLISDITAGSKLGLIGNAKFVNELIKEVQEIEKERTEVQKGDKDKEHLTPAQKAIKEYKELLKEITEKYRQPERDEFIKQEAYTVLKEDIEYIISHIK